MRSMRNVAVLTEGGAFTLFFRHHPGGFDSSSVPTLWNLPSKKAIGLDWQNNHSARATHSVFVRFFAVTARLRWRENAHANSPFVVNVKKWTQDNYFDFLFLIFDTVFKNVSPEKIGNIWRIERDGISVKFESAQIHFFEWPSRSRRLRWCLNSRFLVQRFLAATVRLAFESFIYPHPSSLLFFHWYISVAGAWFHCIGVGAHGWKARVC